MLAGAGTGKTRAITYRIAYTALSGTVDPAHVLALTFTVRAAGELRGRLRQLGVGQVRASTFHAAALRQLNHFWPRVIGGRPPQLIDSKAGLVREAAKRARVRLDGIPGALADTAAEMRARLVALGVDGVQARTFHAAALRQVRYFAPRLLSGKSMPELVDSKARLVTLAAARSGLRADRTTARDLAAEIEWVILPGATSIGRALIEDWYGGPIPR